MSYLIQDIIREQDNQGLGINPRHELVIMDVTDISYFPKPDEKGVRITDDIVMNKGAYAFRHYMTPGTVEVTSAASGDTDAVGFTPQVKFNFPGNTIAVREFKTWAVNRRFIVAVRYCDGRPTDLVGTPCNPCKLTPSYTGNNESSANEMTFEQTMKGSDIFAYEGTFTYEEPVSTLDAGATTLKFIGSGQYQTSEGSGSIGAIDGGADGDIVTIVGCAGTSPTVAPVEGKIILKGGRSFTASLGSQLTLRAMATGSGDIVWVEQSRYQAA